MMWLLSLKVQPRWLGILRVAAALALGAAVSTLIAGRVSPECQAELEQVVDKLFGL